jgi:hypothetical protein
MAKFSLYKNGTWYTAKKFFINKAGTWYQAKKMWINKAGTWQLAYTGLEPTSASLYMYDYGTSTSLTWYSTGASENANWLSDVAAGNGANFWIKFTRSGALGTLSGGKSYNTWYQMTSDIAITLTASAGVFRSATGTYEVAESNGGPVIATANWEITINE